MKKPMGWLFVFIIAIAFIYVSFKMALLPPTYNGIASVIVDDTISKTGAINAVTAVVFDFRGYDTLGESFVLFTAVCGSAAILRKTIMSKGEH